MIQPIQLAWFPTNTTSGQQHILWQGYSGGNRYGSAPGTAAQAEMGLTVGHYNAANKISFFLGYDVTANGANCIEIVSSSNFTDTSSWHHVAVTVTDLGGGTFSASLYVDGNLEGTDTGAQNDRSQWGALQIGAPSASSRLFNGQIDEVRVYDAALSIATVQSIAKAGVLQNDSDIDNNIFKVNTSVVTGPSNGTLSIDSDGSFTYSPNSNFNGTDTFTYRANDNTVDSNIATVTITVNSVNDAPVLSDTALSITVAEDAGVPSGVVGSLVSSFTGGVSDVDSGAVKGIAITASVETNGTWYYTTNNGSNWTAVGTVSSASSLLLADNAKTRLYFAPGSNYNGTSSSALTVRGWDQTSGTADTRVSTSSNGGITAFSSATDVVDVSVTAVNDEQILTTNSGKTVSENSTGNSITNSILLTSDVDNTASQLIYTVTSATNVAENSTTVTTVAATDGDLPDATLTYSITGGADSSLCAIHNSTGILTLVSGRNRESHTDSDLNGTYEVTVRVSDGANTDSQDISVTITDY